MQRMGITDTQYIVARHTDTGHPHIHIVYNRVRYDRQLVPDNNERRRNTTVCKTIKLKYGLTFSEGKKKVKTEKLHDPDRVKYAIYGAVKSALSGCLIGGVGRGVEAAGYRDGVGPPERRPDQSGARHDLYQRRGDVQSLAD